MNGVHRLLSRREKHAKSGNPAADRNGLFVLDDNYRKPSKEEEKKIKDVMHHLDALGAKHFTEAQCYYALRQKSVDGDTRKALNLLMLLEDSVAGVLKPYDPSITMLGAVNRSNTTCYLDSLLFAMFARLNSFEGILYPAFNDEPRKRLATVLRLWVNMLRTGRLVTVDIAKQLQEALAKCGWEDAARLKQQDVSEAFTFITDKLELPLLTLKMDLFHTGKEDASDDHKFVNERLLEVGIPEDLIQDGKISLEDCLENYFNNRVEVKRHLSRLSSIQMQMGSDITKSGVNVDVTEINSRQNSFATVIDDESISATPPRPMTLRQRATSIFGERKIEFEVEEPVDPDKKGVPAVLRRRRKSSMRKEVLMPAWQFFSLIPWYTRNSPRTNAQIAAHFASKRPVLGICLKRYKVTARGGASRLDTHVDIPLDIALPHFMSDDNLDGDAVFHRTFKLSLVSVICHRGIAVDGGHYISFTKTESDGRTDWLRFDDLAGVRVKSVDINDALKSESPYLLFYQIQPIDAGLPDEDLPPYEEHPIPYDTLEEKLNNLNMSARISVEEVENSHSPRASFEEAYRGRSTVSTPRRASLAWTDNSSIGGASNKTDPGQSELRFSQDGEKAYLQPSQNPPARPVNSGGRATSTSSDKRFGTVSRITSRLSGGGGGRRGSNPDILSNQPVEDTRSIGSSQLGNSSGSARATTISDARSVEILPPAYLTSYPRTQTDSNPAYSSHPSQSDHQPSHNSLFQHPSNSTPAVSAYANAPGSKTKLKGKESRNKLLRGRDKTAGANTAAGTRRESSETPKSYSKLGAKPPERECTVM